MGFCGPLPWRNWASMRATPTTATFSAKTRLSVSSGATSKSSRRNISAKKCKDISIFCQRSYTRCFRTSIRLEKGKGWWLHKCRDLVISSLYFLHRKICRILFLYRRVKNQNFDYFKIFKKIIKHSVSIFFYFSSVKSEPALFSKFYISFSLLFFRIKNKKISVPSNRIALLFQLYFLWFICFNSVKLKPAPFFKFLLFSFLLIHLSVFLLDFSCAHFVHFNPGLCLGCRYIQFSRKKPPWKVSKNWVFPMFNLAFFRFFLFWAFVSTKYPAFCQVLGIFPKKYAYVFDAFSFWFLAKF